MYTLFIEYHLHAAHAVHQPDGSLEELHWHKWLIQPCWKSASLDKQGMVVDFLAAREQLHRIIEPLQGRVLNDEPRWRDQPPTAERLAQWIFHQLAAWPCAPAQLAQVQLQEAPGCWAIFTADQ
ncbi:MAG: hypothetical protein HJJLKODD_01029 [Phycisphaerae bacterium]|nr:hypothetical protein [Phycisphaerae bacterium]